jgi:hypothetical protein
MQRKANVTGCSAFLSRKDKREVLSASDTCVLCAVQVWDASLQFRACGEFFIWGSSSRMMAAAAADHAVKSASTLPQLQ